MKKTVLAIDDSRTIRDLLTHTLTQAGFNCISAVDGRDGVEKFVEVKPDAVITDINMPNLDGFGVIDELRGENINSTVPILVLTTESSSSLKSRAHQAGATGWIVKPFDDISLVSVMRRVTGQFA
jgi:two-component system chemotaxis response regulator CheY